MTDIGKEKLGWLLLAEKNLAKLWNSPQDKKAWSKYLKIRAKPLNSNTLV